MDADTLGGVVLTIVVLVAITFGVTALSFNHGTNRNWERYLVASGLAEYTPRFFSDGTIVHPASDCCLLQK